MQDLAITDLVMPTAEVDSLLSCVLEIAPLNLNEVSLSNWNGLDADLDVAVLNKLGYHSNSLESLEVSDMSGLSATLKEQLAAFAEEAIDSSDLLTQIKLSGSQFSATDSESLLTAITSSASMKVIEVLDFTGAFDYSQPDSPLHLANIIDGAESLQTLSLSADLTNDYPDATLVSASIKNSIRGGASIVIRDASSGDELANIPASRYPQVESVVIVQQ